MFTDRFPLLNTKLEAVRKGSPLSILGRLAVEASKSRNAEAEITMFTAWYRKRVSFRLHLYLSSDYDVWCVVANTVILVSYIIIFSVFDIIKSDNITLRRCLKIGAVDAIKHVYHYVYYIYSIHLLALRCHKICTPCQSTFVNIFKVWNWVRCKLPSRQIIKYI